jgi:phosphoribosyl 1,2-cyclic phosphodiesterase
MILFFSFHSFSNEKRVFGTFVPMPIFIASLNSGSNANCYYAGNHNEAVLIDAGLSCRETEKRMKQIGLDMSKVKALFISHEHSDHITGMTSLSRKYRLPVYITDNTFRQSQMPLEKEQARPFHHGKAIRIGEMKILPFKKSHDAADPHSFMISQGGLNIGVITDIGYACKRVIKYFSQCHAAFLETNYCDNMLTNGSYPWHLKKRISSDEGHLSNDQALDLFLNYRSADLRLLILSHLSKNNNKPELVASLFKPHAGNTRVIVASRYEPTPVFRIDDSPQPARKLKGKKNNETQLSLF